MQLEKVTAKVRPRTAWEAVDLGFLMLQRWYRPVLASWLIITLPIFFLINALLFNHPFLAALAFWWLLPMFDRIPLHVLSRALFAETVTPRMLLKDWAKILLPHIFKSLTIYRLDFSRSYNLPVWQLEKLSGRARVQRNRVLKKSQSSTAVGLTIMCLAIEIIVFISLYGLIMLLLPNYYDSQMMSALFHTGKLWWAGPLANFFLYLTFLLIEPFYVAGGFSLYINRRTELEGWDIEINFRQLAQRAGSLASRMMILVGVLVALQGAGLLFSPNAQAAAIEKPAKSVQSATNNAVAKKAIEKIMRDKTFHDKEKVSGWHLRNKEKNSKDGDKFHFGWSGLSWLGEAIAQIGQLAMWILLAVLVGLIIYFFVKWIPPAAERKGSQRQPAQPKSLFGLDISPESLPEDVADAALALWQAGKAIDALSLLYRGALAGLVHRYGINLRGSATEGDCIRIVARHRDRLSQPAAEFFQLLTRQWQYAAYAHHRPEDTVMGDLCETWSRHFGAEK